MRDEKLTVAVTPVTNESKVEHVKRLLSKVFELGIKVKILLLDSGYYTVDIINYLKAKGINFIMRAKGKFKDGDTQQAARGKGQMNRQQLGL